MYSQSAEIGILEALENKIFFAANHHHGDRKIFT